MFVYLCFSNQPFLNLNTGSTEETKFSWSIKLKYVYRDLFIHQTLLNICLFINRVEHNTLKQ